MLLTVDAGSGVTRLTIVHVNAPHRPVDCSVKICVWEDDVLRKLALSNKRCLDLVQGTTHRALSTQLQSNLLQVRAGGRLEDRASSHRRAGERHLIDVHMLSNGCPYSLTISRNEIDSPSRESSF